MNAEATEEFQWIYDDDVTVTPIDPTQPLDTIYNLDSATDSPPSLGQNDDVHFTSVEELPGERQRQAKPAPSSASKPLVEAHALPPMYAVDEPYIGTGVANFPPVPEPPVNTAPRPITIVWGFIIMAIGVLAISFAAGAAVDLGLVLIWLPAICGIALTSAAIFATVKKTSAW